jgi:hypothetical protein
VKKAEDFEELIVPSRRLSSGGRILFFGVVGSGIQDGKKQDTG